MKKRKNNLPEGDDGKTIVDMNVEGMPWYHKTSPDHVDDDGATSKPGDHYQMSDKEARYYTFAALKWALLIGLIYAAVFALFILFCTQVWFK